MSDSTRQLLATARATRMSHVTVLPRDHEWTVADLALLPEDGLQYQLVDGMLLVSPAPSLDHHACQKRLFRMLDPHVPDDRLCWAPVDYQPTEARSFQPDLMILHPEELGRDAARLPLVLALEVVSPSSRSVDLVLKRALYEQAGVAHYWVADPDRRELVMWALVDGRYGEPLVLRDGADLSVVAPVTLTTLTAEAVFGPA